ncbi:MAG: tripartite tricarboxylate transporter substrate binding protein [Alphaproteobacteria bacterium]|nr:tripartite tricarboxylate transporter substrate binding protein [Alphaproteobacteria bacterium]
MNRRDFGKSGLAALAATALPFPAFAYPDRPIRLVVPFSPGGATDVVEMLMGLGSLGTVIVENKGGAGGIIGATEVARAQPDGHTFLFGNTSTQVLLPAISANPPYDPAKAFAGIYIMAISPNTIVVHESVPARTLKELIAYAKANPGKLSYGSAGTGTMTNLAGEHFKQIIGVSDITHIPYKGAAPGLKDLAGGIIPMMTPNVGGPLLELHKAGKVRILAVMAEKRLQAAPEIPTTAEAGVPNLIAANFNGLFAPAGVPKAIMDRIATATATAMKDAAVQNAIVNSGFEPVLDSGPDAAQKTVASELARWTPVIKSIGFKPQ